MDRANSLIGFSLLGLLQEVLGDVPDQIETQAADQQNCPPDYLSGALHEALMPADHLCHPHATVAAQPPSGRLSAL